MSKRLANGLIAQSGCNLQKNDTIGLLLPNIPEFAPAIFGGLEAGLRVALANPLYTAGTCRLII